MESFNKTVLITGAGGFIGLNTVKAFAQHGFHVLAMVHKNLPEELQKIEGIEIIRADVTDEFSVAGILNGRTPDIIVQVAGLASDIGSDELFRKINFEPVKFLSKMAKEKFVYISSTDVYGIKDFHGEDETLQFEEYPINPYPKYKILSEQWLRENIEPDKYVIIRPAAVWGEGDKTLENRVVEFLSVSPFIIHFGKWKGQNRWPLANVKNVADTCVAVCLTDEFNGEAINIIDEEFTTIDRYYRSVAQEYFPEKKFKTVTLPLGVGKMIGYVSTFFSNLFRCKKPLFDPTSYSVMHVSSNLDFSGEKMKKALSVIRNNID